MSNHHSTCIPPPSSYAPRPGAPNQSRFRERGGRGRGRGNYRTIGGQHRHESVSFNRDSKQEEEDKTIQQPRDKFHHNEDDDYFARIDDDNDEYIKGEREDADENENKCDQNVDDEEDPLDLFMQNLEKPNSNQKVTNLITDPTVSDVEIVRDDSNAGSLSKPSTSNAQESEKKGVRLDIDASEDLEESFYKYVEQTKRKQSSQDGYDSAQEQQDSIEYDNFGNPIGVRQVKREVDPLPSIDHKTIDYNSFQKNFYQEHEDIEKLTPEQSEQLRAKLEIKVFGKNPQKPVCSFAHFKFDEQLMRVIRRSEYTQPTPIQAQAIPAILSGRNVVGIAMTGSGKTAAFLWPMLIHIRNQSHLKRGDGPIGVILEPTRELALQVYSEAKKFANTYKLNVVCAYGGGSKYLQSEDLKAGAEIVVATPGRLIDLVKIGATNLRRVTYLVLDEADRFFDMGFEAQVRSICNNIRPDRQTLLFSATFKKRIEQLALTVTEDPVKIVQRALGEVSEDVTQHVIVMKGEKPDGKWSWLNSRLVEFTSSGSVLIFVTRIANCEELHNNLKQQGKETLLLHGDMEQAERNRVITAFRRKELDVMIATDVAARGLDISHIRTVINYDVARDIDTHTHRVGRTGRAGIKGDAYTLVGDKDKEFAGHLVKNLESSSQVVSEDLMKLAMQSHTFRKSRFNLSSKHKQHRSHDHQDQRHQHNRPHGMGSNSGSSSHNRGYHSEGNSSRHTNFHQGSSHSSHHKRSPERRHDGSRSNYIPSNQDRRQQFTDKRPRWN